MNIYQHIKSTSYLWSIIFIFSDLKCDLWEGYNAALTAGIKHCVTPTTALLFSNTLQPLLEKSFLVVYQLEEKWKFCTKQIQEIMPKTGSNTKKNKNKHGILTGMMYCTVAMCIGV
jgi:hypothetical protein